MVLRRICDVVVWRNCVVVVWRICVFLDYYGGQYVVIVYMEYLCGSMQDLCVCCM
jgi:hypothetical protein